MYSEIIKIIEGGLNLDREKVYNYSSTLSKLLREDGEASFAKVIDKLLLQREIKFATLDSFTTKPVDTESRLDIADISFPTQSSSKLVLNKYIQQEIDVFVEGFEKREKIISAGLDSPNTLLLYGPPGCGKTSVAQYISQKTQLPLITARFDGLISSLLGSTARNIRKVFDYASKRNCILFLDEFDVIAKMRDDKNELGELKRVVNSLLQNMDYFNSGNLLIAATNHHELLDSAVWRRFSRIVELNNPSPEDIPSLLCLFLDNVSNSITNNDVKLKKISNAFIDMSPSDIKTIVQNSIRNRIICEKTEIDCFELLYEVFFFKNHGIISQTELINYLLSNGITKKDISVHFSISQRQLNSIIKGEA